ARMPPVFLGRLEVEAAHLAPGEIHLHHVLDRRVAERDAGGGTEVPVGARNAHADVAARPRGEPALAGVVADVDEVLLQVQKIHAGSSTRDRRPISTARTVGAGASPDRDPGMRLEPGTLAHRQRRIAHEARIGLRAQAAPERAAASRRLPSRVTAARAESHATLLVTGSPPRPP